MNKKQTQTLIIVGVIILAVVTLSEKKEVSLAECNPGAIIPWVNVLQLQEQCEAEGFTCIPTQIQGYMGVIECVGETIEILNTYQPDSVSGEVQVLGVSSRITENLDYEVTMTLKNTNPSRSAEMVVEVQPTGVKGAKAWVIEFENSGICDSAQPENRFTHIDIGPNDQMTFSITVPNEDILNKLGGQTVSWRLISYDTCCPGSVPECVQVSPFYDSASKDKNIISEMSVPGSGGCVEECWVNEIGCTDSNTRWYCGESGDGDACREMIPAACGAGETCTNGECGASSCPIPGDSYPGCDGLVSTQELLDYMALWEADLVTTTELLDVMAVWEES